MCHDRSSDACLSDPMDGTPALRRVRRWAADPRSWLPAAWSLVLAALMLGPALGRGFVLSYDMVWVPDLALRADTLGLGTGLPRAVPSDAVVAVFDELIPGMLLQKLVLLGALTAAGIGAQRLVGGSTLPRLVAVSAYIWNPFVGERLWIGHWPLIVGYAVLPWVAVSAARVRRGTGPGRALIWLLPLGSLTPQAGLMTGLLALACGVDWRAPGRWRRASWWGAGAVLANAPWVVAGLLHASTARSESADVFALTGEGSLPAPLTALGLGGIWNSEVVPASREGLMAWAALVGWGALAALGVSVSRRDREVSYAPLALCWGVGLVLALLPVLAPGVVDAVATAVPGGGLLRDSGRFLALCAPLLVVLVAGGVQRIGEALDVLPARVALALAASLFPVMVMPDLAWGVGGALRGSDYPADYAEARSALAAQEDDEPGDVVILPFTSYRAPAWTDGRKIFSPLGRYLTPPDVTSDELLVSGERIPGEDPRGDQVRAALSESTPEGRSAALAALGIQYAAVEAAVAGADGETDLAGAPVHLGADVSVVRIADVAVPRVVPRAWWLWTTGAWLGWAALPFWSVLGTRWRRR
jgi:hypothetical protein